MHIGGEGTVEKLASGVRKVLDKVKDVRSTGAQPGKTFGRQPLPAKSSVTAAPLTAQVHRGAHDEVALRVRGG